MKFFLVFSHISIKRYGAGSDFGLLMQAIIVSCCGCFHGRTLGAISMSCDNDATRGFGPLVPGQLKVDFGDANALEKAFKGL